MNAPEQHLDDEDDRNPVERIAAEFIERMRAGESPSVDEYAERYPEIADEVRDLLPAVLAMEELKIQRETPARSRFLRGPGTLRKLGDYLILQEIGRGGMGIVYEAEQQSLGRRVAVKVLPRQSLLDEQRLKRFEREAQTAARLHHTNIVPIFGVGEQDGYHYYVMQMIRGLGLDRVIRALRGERSTHGPGSATTQLGELALEAASGMLQGRFRNRPVAATPPTPTPGAAAADAESTATAVDEPPAPVPASFRPGAAYWRSVARVGLQVADALSYAHTMGTLHRDIKPANLLLDEHGVVWVTDFGLAKAIEEAHLTATGDVVGTLQYMAPEQFCGEYDARSDLYCLGLTLYELLTLQPAFSGSNRSTLMQLVTAGRPTPPRRLRPGIPADLETIVLKTINREPQHRYRDADELRQDLQRFLEDRPIRARRANAAQLTWRWCRRNRALAAALLVATLAVLAAAAIGWTNYAREAATTAAMRLTNQQLRAAKLLAQKNLSQALRGFAGVFNHIAGPDLFQPIIRNSAVTGTETGESETYQDISTPIPSPRDAELLQAILEVYTRFDAENRSNTDLRGDIANANHRIGDIRMRLGDLDQAQQAYLAAIVLYRELGADTHAVTIAALRNQLGQVYAQKHMVETARDSHMEVLTALRDDAGTPRFDSNQALYELARAHDFLGSWGRQPDDEVNRNSRDPRGGRGRRFGGRSLPWPGRWNRRRFPFTDPVRRSHHVAAQKLLKGLLDREPNNVAFRLAKARSCRNYYSYLWLGRALERRESADRPLAHLLLSEAIGILESLAEEFPDAWLYQFELAETLNASRPIEANVDSIARALQVVRGLRENSPAVPSYAALESRVLRNLAEYERSRDPARERGYLVSAVELLGDLVRRWPQNWSYLRQLVDARRTLVDRLRAQQDLLTAKEHAQAMTRENEQFLGKTDGPKADYHRLADDYWTLAQILRSLGEDDAAETATTRSFWARSQGGPERRR